MSVVETIEVALPNGLSADVQRAGAGSPLVFLHGRSGRYWGDFLDGLAQSFEVIAPLHPGIKDEADLTVFDSVHDLVLFYDDLFKALGLDRPTLMGHSFGGMVASEYAAHFPDKVEKLVLIDALGLWRDETPVSAIDSVPPGRVPAVLFADPAQESVQTMLAVPEDPAAQAGTMLERMATVAATNHFIWPIPDRNLERRLHRVENPTLLVWGEQDAYVPSYYAQLFEAKLSNAETVTLADAGHHPHVEASELALASVARFLAS